MKILHILNSDFGVQGMVGLRALPTAEILKKNNVNLTIFCRDYNPNLEGEFNFVKILPFGSLPMKVLTAIPIYVYKKFPAEKYKTILAEYSLIQKLKKINLNEVDIVHSWDFLPETFRYIKEQNPNVKIIKDLMMAFPNLLKGLKEDEFTKSASLEPTDIEKKSIKYVDYYIFPSDNVAKSLVDYGIKKSKLLKITYGVDLKKFKPLKNKNYNGTFKISFSGNINHRKGISYLIKAFKELNLKDAQLNLYGRVYNEILPDLKDAQKYNIYARGYVDLTKELTKNLVHVHPSLLDTSPKTMNEALACGLPVITTYNSGPSFTNGKEGFVVAHQSVKELKEKLLFFYNNRKELEKFSKRARKLAEKKDWRKYGQEVYDNYKQICNR